LQIDLAAILLSAGIHKLLTGYACNDGMQFGLVNPQWGYWYRLWRRVPPGHLLFRVLNHLAWSVELLAALLMLIPATRFLGAVLVVASFAFLVTQIRLFLLAEMVMLAGVLFFAPGTLGARALESLPVWPGTSVAGVLPGAWQTGLGAALWGYLLLLPLVHGGLALNYYGCRRLWALPQTALDVYANLFGIIVWRVFSADHTSFFVNIYRQRRAQPWSRELVTHHERPCSRFNHVAESIALVCIFTTLKYYPDNGALFSERLWRHARTLPRGAGEDLVFVYASIRVTPAGFVVTPVAEFLVDVEQETITKRLLEKQAARELHAARPGSAQRPARQPGSYAA